MIMALNVSAFTPVRKNSISSDDPDGKTAIQFPDETPYRSHEYRPPWWNIDSSMVQPAPLWSWWGLQSHRLSSLYRYPHYTNVSDDEKPSQSYIGLIAEAILSSQEEKLILSDIYGFILANYPYFRNKGTGWRNSIRHNLSLNDCFIKAGRSQNGKGHFWAISHLYIDDFRRGDFRRKRTYRRPNRGKKARAKLEAMKIKASLEYQETNELERNERELLKYELTHCQKDPEHLDDNAKIIKDPIEVEQRGKEFIGQDKLCESLETDDEKVVPPSPKCGQRDDYQEIDVCTTDVREPPKKPTHKPLEERNILDETKMQDPRAQRTKSFDMETLLGRDRTQGLGIVREMYPMYYNIMRLGMRNLEPVDCYGPSHPYCGHCCAMPFPSEHRELRRPMPVMASYGSVPHDDNKTECME